MNIDELIDEINELRNVKKELSNEKYDYSNPFDFLIAICNKMIESYSEKKIFEGKSRKPGFENEYFYIWKYGMDEVLEAIKEVSNRFRKHNIRLERENAALKAEIASLREKEENKDILSLGERIMKLY